MDRYGIRLAVEYFLRRQTLSSIMTAFFISYVLFFITPVFLNAEHKMLFFQTVPAVEKIGIDLLQVVDYSKTWLLDNRTPYIGNNLYPPLASVLFSPLVMLDYPINYAVLTIVTLGCYCFLMLLVSAMIRKTEDGLVLLILLASAGLFSYGFQFELERGQFNVIAFFFCLLAIYIFHYHHKVRIVAYLLFSLSIQLKVYPAIFIMMFIKDWSDWKNNVKRIAGITVFNFVLLFTLGYGIFLDFVGAIQKQTTVPSLFLTNHSIKSFLDRESISGTWIGLNASPVQFAWTAFVAVCLFLIILKAYRHKIKGFNPYLLLGCTVSSLLLPSVSHDYKLSILTAPFIIAFSVIPPRPGWRKNILTGAAALAYASTLFSYANKPFFLRNNLFALSSLLLLFTLMALFDNRLELSAAASGESRDLQSPGSRPGAPRTSE